ncbi:MAG: DUF2071 domain-containing protein, partial [Candidatus Tectomicrobia bacterium]
VLVSLQNPLLWVHPFGALTKNLPIVAGTALILHRSWQGQLGQAPPAPLLTAHWHNLLLLTYAVAPERLASYLPPGVELDRRHGQAFVSLLSLDFEGLRLLGFPCPGWRRFPDVNLRIYVRRAEQRGVVFVREIVPSRLLAWMARRVSGEPFLAARLESTQQEYADRVVVERRLHVGGRVHTMRGEGSKPAFLPEAESAEHFLKERYWGFGTDRCGRPRRFRVEHPAWEVYPVQSYSLELDWEQVYGPDWAFLRHATPDSIVFAVGSAVAVYSR